MSPFAYISEILTCRCSFPSLSLVILTQGACDFSIMHLNSLYSPFKRSLDFMQQSHLQHVLSFPTPCMDCWAVEPLWILMQQPLWSNDENTVVTCILFPSISITLRLDQVYLAGFYFCEYLIRKLQVLPHAREKEPFGMMRLWIYVIGHIWGNFCPYWNCNPLSLFCNNLH